MTPNTSDIVPQLRQEFEALIDYVSGPTSTQQDAYSVERHLFRQLLRLGARLLSLFFRTQAALRPPTPHTPQGLPLRYHGRRSIRYISVFGEFWVARHYFTAPGAAGQAPLDATLSLPSTAYSALLHEWAAYGSTEQAFRENQALLERLLGLSVPVATLEQQVARSARNVDAFYQQRPAPEPAQEGALLVAQADGKGVPLVQPPSTQPLRLGKGHKRGTKKEALVTCLYTIAPYVRTPEQVLAALLREGGRPPAEPRPQPQAKEQRATLAGKAIACQRLAQRAQAREGAHIQQRVALTDGSEALQQQMQTHLPGFTLVLDIIHASEYLWDAATALLGETAPERLGWVRTKLRLLLEGQTDTVIQALETAAGEAGCTTSQRDALQRTSGYYRRNAAYMRYNEYLAQGWPIGTGVVEGACRHLVKDRLERAGMRWTVEGAQAILDLRAVRLNGDWDTYWRFHRQQQHQHLYGTSSTSLPEEKLFQQVA